MKLPYPEQALLAHSKITEYLLHEGNESGKAGFFIRFGFSVSQWNLLAEALLEHAKTYEVVQAVTTQHGTKYIIEGKLSTPDERNPTIRAIWLIEHEQTTARFITAYPMKG